MTVLRCAVNQSSTGIHDSLKFKNTTSLELVLRVLTISIPIVTRVKFQHNNSKGKKKKNKRTQCTMTNLLLKRFQLNRHTVGFHLQTQKLEPPYKSPSFTHGLE